MCGLVVARAWMLEETTDRPDIADMHMAAPQRFSKTIDAPISKDAAVKETPQQMVQTGQYILN